MESFLVVRLFFGPSRYHSAILITAVAAGRDVGSSVFLFFCFFEFLEFFEFFLALFVRFSFREICTHRNGIFGCRFSAASVDFRYYQSNGVMPLWNFTATKQ